MRQAIYVVFLAMLLGMAVLVQATTPAKPATAPCPPPARFDEYYYASVSSVYDGDTFTSCVNLGCNTMRARQKIRPYNLDAPELHQPGGKASREWLRQRIEGKEVVLQTIRNDDRGKYGRLLAIVWLRENNKWRCVNEEIVAAGHAVRKEY